MGNFRHDLRFAVRMLVKNPLFTAAAVLTLALGIGLNTAVFSAVYALLFRPLPEVHDDEQLVHLYRTWPGDRLFGSNSIPHYQDVRDRVEAFDGQVAAWTFTPFSLSADGQSERVIGVVVSANFFQVLGAPPSLGRGFLPEEARDPGAHRVIVLGYAFWQTRFGGEPSVVGRSITLNGQSWTIVGVARRGFRGTMPVVDPPVYVPLMMQREVIPGPDLLESRGNNSFSVFARLAPGMTPTLARQQLDALIAQLRDEHPENYRESTINLVPRREAGLHPSLRGAQVRMSAVMMVVVAFLLFIACINVANLFLARAADRQREMGIRLSLGAERRRIVSQLLTESVLFSLIAGGAGLLLAHLVIRVVNSIQMPVGIPVTFDVRLDSTVLLFALGLSLLTGVLFGLAPALQTTKPEMVSALKGEASLRPGGTQRVTNVLVVAQTALSTVLLISSGLFLQGLRAATMVDKGFDEQNLLLASVDPGLQGYDRERSETLYRVLKTNLENLPGVQAVGYGSEVPLSLSSSDASVRVPGYDVRPNERMGIRYNLVTPGYFAALRIPVYAGRAFRDEDGRNGAPVIIVNQKFADRFWPGEDAVGKIVDAAGAEREVIGVVKTGKYDRLGEEPQDFMYLPQAQSWAYAMILFLRTTGDPQALIPTVRREVRRLDPALPLADVQTMTEQLGVVLLPARLGGATLGAFGIIGMLLAAVGIYGVMAYGVSQRTREIGLRVALGADRGQVVMMVIRKGMFTVGAGVGLGLAAAMGASRLMASMLYGVSAVDPATFFGVPALLGVVALVATFLPARRAASTDPMMALRAE